MRVLYIHQFFAGPSAPGPAQPRKLVRSLADRGHVVDVVAGDFNAYSEQDEPPEDYASPAGGRVVVHRLQTRRKLRASLLNRLRTYFGFACAAYRYGRSLPPPDVVMVSIQPLFSGASALLLARRFRKPFLLEVRDLWPDALVVKGAISNWQAAPLHALANALYRRADRLVSLTPGIKDELLKKGVRPDHLDLFPNGFDADTFRLPSDTRERVRAEYGWKNQFVAVYTGTHTEVTAIDVIVRAAEALRSRKDIRIDLFGAGQSKPGAIALAKELGLDNIHFHDAVPKTQIAGILAGSDAGIMTLFRSPLAHIYFENKLIDYMGACRPIVGAMDGMQSDIIAEAGSGSVVPAGDHAGLARLIVELADRPDLGLERGAAGHRYIQAHLDQRVILDHYAVVLEALARGEGACVQVWDPLS
jgi:glycosyltransferase involved in cell wall biosynthesis